MQQKIYKIDNPGVASVAALLRKKNSVFTLIKA